MNKLTRDKQAQVIAALVEGNSIRATVRMTGVSKDAIARLLVSVGNASMAYQDRTLRNLKCKRIQCDEAWSFCYAKDINLPASKQGKYGYGSVWTWVAIDADSKLVPSFRVGNRDFQTAKLFIDDLASRLANRVQLTSDGLKVYLEVVENAFGCEVDYAMLVKLFGSDPQGDEKRYSPATCDARDRRGPSCASWLVLTAPLVSRSGVCRSAHAVSVAVSCSSPSDNGSQLPCRDTG